MKAAIDPGRRQRGAALLIVIWAVILLAGFVAGVLATGGSEAALSASMIDAARARHLAAAGVQRAVLALLDPAERGKLQLAQPVTFAMRLSDDASISIRIKDSCGGIDLNWAAPELLRAYALAAGMPPAAALGFAKAVTDGRGPGPQTHWQSVGEITALPGMSAALLAALAEGLTVNCRDAGADPGRAGVLVKQALLLAGGEAAHGGVSHQLAYEVLSVAQLSSGARAAIMASIWLTVEPGAPYRITAWERQ